MFVLLFCYIMNVGMKNKLLIILSIALSALFVSGMSIFATLDLVEHDTSWAKKIEFKEGVYIGETIVDKKNRESIPYQEFRFEMKLISNDEYVNLGELNSIAIYRNRETGFYVQYYSMNFYVRYPNVLTYEHLDIYNLDYSHNYSRTGERNVYFYGTISRDDFRISVNKEGLDTITYGDYSSKITYRSEI